MIVDGCCRLLLTRRARARAARRALFPLARTQPLTLSLPPNLHPPKTKPGAVRAGAAPHSMPVALPNGAATRPHQPLPSIVNGAGRAPEEIAAAMRADLAALQHQALATGISPSTYARVRELLPGVKYQARAQVLMAKSEDGALQRLPGTVGVVGADAGQLDLVKILLQHLGAFAIVKDGVLASDAASLAAAAPALQVCDVVIVVAGADAALPAAVAALVDAPVLAAPAPGCAPAAPPAPGAAPYCVTAADGGVSAAVTAARALRVAATRAMQIAESAAANAQAAAAASAAAAAAEAPAASPF